MSSASKHEHAHHPHAHHEHSDSGQLHALRAIVYAPPALRSPVLSGVGQRVAVVSGVVCVVWLAVLWALQNNG